MLQKANQSCRAAETTPIHAEYFAYNKKLLPKVMHLHSIDGEQLRGVACQLAGTRVCKHQPGTNQTTLQNHSDSPQPKVSNILGWIQLCLRSMPSARIALQAPVVVSSPRLQW